MYASQLKLQVYKASRARVEQYNRRQHAAKAGSSSGAGGGTDGGLSLRLPAGIHTDGGQDHAALSSTSSSTSNRHRAGNGTHASGGADLDWNVLLDPSAAPTPTRTESKKKFTRPSAALHPRASPHGTLAPPSAFSVSQLANASPDLTLVQLRVRLDTMNSDHCWPQLLAKVVYCMPEGVLENIVEYIPTPRIWNWSLYRYARTSPTLPAAATLH